MADKNLRASNKEFATLCKYVRENAPWDSSTLEQIRDRAFEQMRRKFAVTTVKEALEFEALDYKRGPVHPGSAPDLSMKIKSLEEDREVLFRRIKWLEFTINNMAVKFGFDLKNQLGQ